MQYREWGSGGWSHPGIRHALRVMSLTSRDPAVPASVGRRGAGG